MRAALAQQLGGIDSVELGELPAPAPAAGQALVRVHGAGVGPWDVGFLGGGFPGIALPFVPGQEVAGVVEAAGDGAGVQQLSHVRCPRSCRQPPATVPQDAQRHGTHRDRYQRPMGATGAPECRP